MLAGCTVPRQYTVHNIPPAGEYSACLRITMTESIEQAQELCRDVTGGRHIACAELPKPDGSPQRLIFWRPVSWNDWLPLTAAGHELIHIIGGTHE